MDNFTKVLDRYRQEAFSRRNLGDRFERLMAAWLTVDPVFSNDIEKVWLWKDFPARGCISHTDIGIDLVVRYKTGEYGACQCKCYQADTMISKADVDTFISTSGKSFTDPITQEQGKRFTKRIWLDTSGLGFSTNAEATIKGQEPPFCRRSLSDFIASPVDFERLDAELNNDGDIRTALKKKQPKEHQLEALRACKAYFKEHERGKLIMACGTGKTFTSLKIAEQQLEGNAQGTVLFLAPSLALVGQTLNEWYSQSEKPLHGVCVCSDETVSVRKSSDKDSDVMHTTIVDLASPASTDVRTLQRYMSDARYAQSRDGGMVVIFSTYQSLSSVHDLQEAEGCEFDLVICDEAHRTTGIEAVKKGSKDTKVSPFIAIHDSNYIKAKHRLYMTATPRLYRAEAKRKAADIAKTKDLSVEIFSMDEPKQYGEEIYRLGFGRAVELGLLSDYKVIVLAVSEDLDTEKQAVKFITDYPSDEPLCMADNANDAQKRRRKGELVITYDETLKLIGVINALSKHASKLDSVHFGDVDPGLMHSAVAFCSTIAESKAVSRALEACSYGYERALLAEGDMPKDFVRVRAEHVDGTMNAQERETALSRLRNVKREPESRDCRLISNVRCLSEGVDVPSLDAVVFMSPKGSEIDVVQSVGRVMRWSEGKKFGYIVIPIFVPAGASPEEALDADDNYATIWTILNALRAHDDRFDALANIGSIREKVIVVKPERILSPRTNDDDYPTQLPITFSSELGQQIYAKLVLRVGTKKYWSKWAEEVAGITQRLQSTITEIISDKSDPHMGDLFSQFHKGLKEILNPSVSETEVIEMLAQQFVTEPVFDALFGSLEFTSHNAMAISMRPITEALHARITQEDNDKLKRFYDDIRLRAKGLNQAPLDRRQDVIRDLYDSFFKIAFEKQASKLGIVYTPVPAVDFIIHFVEDVLRKEFRHSMADENVHILDPFTGTGTFITRLLQSGIIPAESLERKYRYELHCNELVLLAYYIASVNIETTFNALNASKEFVPFEGICFTDTFQMTEPRGSDVSGQMMIENVFAEDAARIKRQRSLPIRVFMGNPPYSIGQGSANDNAANQHYLQLEKHIADTYAIRSKAKQKRALYDSYVKAFRWCSDCLEALRTSEQAGGVIAFITGNGWLDNSAMDGMRKTLVDEFDCIYIYNLRGNQRSTMGELSRKEGGKLFGEGSRTGIAVTLLVKKRHVMPDKKQPAKIFYYEVEDYLSRDEKLRLLKDHYSMLSGGFEFRRIIPDEHGDWLTQRTGKFEEFCSLGDKNNAQNTKTFFVPLYSNGLLTGRNSWCYNSSRVKLMRNMSDSITFYNAEVERVRPYFVTHHYAKAEDAVNMDSTKFSWDQQLKKDVVNGRSFKYDEANIVHSMYKPFFLQHVYFSRSMNSRVCQLPQLFPVASCDNLIICVHGLGALTQPSCFICNCIVDYKFLDGGVQCFPLYIYRQSEDTDAHQCTLFESGEPHYERESGITDFIFGEAQRRYGPTVTREDIFYYVYGILHSRTYRAKFSGDLKRMLPRLPLLRNSNDFWQFSRAGRQLADLHINYETVEPYADVTITGDTGENYRVTKMKLSKDETTLIYNDLITVSNIPARAKEYVVNGRSPLGWMADRYCVKTDKDSGLVNDANDWATEHGNPRYILDLVLRLITVSLKTLDIMDSLPDVDWDNE